MSNNPTTAKAPPAVYFCISNGLTPVNGACKMLTLGRKSGEAVLIGDNVTVTAYTEKDSNEIKLVFVAPKEIRILREDLVKIQKISDN
jgi:carbon storage regulator CsrA